MADYFLGEIRPFAFNFAPLGWQPCNGQLLAIAQNAALFSILGTQYGGNGTTTFALPNLQGAALVNQGQLPGGSTYSMGETDGAPQVTVLPNEIPAHTHSFSAATAGPVATEVGVETNAPGNGLSYLSNLVGKSAAGSNITGFAYETAAAVNTVLAPAAISQAGGNQPHDNMPPYLTITYCIALTGIFPARN
jgi:microcystin-dependent protein